jgi:hypothetical protein
MQRTARQTAEFRNFSPLHDAHNILWATLLPLSPIRAITPADIVEADPALTLWETSDSISITAYDNGAHQQPDGSPGRHSV